MTDLTDADDAVVAAAHGVVTGERTEGTRNLRRVDRDDGPPLVYRVDPDIGASQVDDVTAEGEFPDADAVLWRAGADRVEREVDRRGLDPG